MPLIAVHGNGVDHRLLLALDPALDAAGGLERTYLDLAGFGRTPRLAGVAGLPELAEWLIGQVRSLVADRRFALLANSLGGLLARAVQTAFPDQLIGVALIAPVVNPDVSLRTLPAFRVIGSDDELLASLSAEDHADFTAMAAMQTRESWELFRRFALPGIRAADTDAMARLAQRYFLNDDSDEVNDVAPFSGHTLILTGRQDHIVGYEDQFRLAARSYPNATYTALHGAGHNAHLDRPEAAAGLVQQWAVQLHG
ncbi:alpha/beta hydrolase [Ornithinimicrobium sp. F0845]|uniref:alpha/beta fold hydrolase n=1 Tax=Ornithinimicrobium sp. F0845 TaxID=2926412 RepID=UPI001FF1B76A|nr:alpha/beta hydrolase [Ornithinimicrobium sp. F0845]